jgi:hypothetical protein
MDTHGIVDESSTPPLPLAIPSGPFTNVGTRIGDIHSPALPSCVDIVDSKDATAAETVPVVVPEFASYASNLEQPSAVDIVECDDVSATFGDEKIEAKIFPSLFPNGRASYHPNMYKANKDKTMSHKHYIKSRLRAPIPLWRHHYTWPFFHFDWQEKLSIHGAQGVMVKPGDATESGVPLDPASAAGTGDDTLKRHCVPSSVSGSKAHAKKRFLDLCAQCAVCGPADVFLTVTPNEAAWADILKRCGVRSPNQCPLEVVEQYHRRWNLLMKRILKDSVLGEVLDYFVRVEYQGRGAPHCHVLFWLKCKKDKCKFVSAIIPDTCQDLHGSNDKQATSLKAVLARLQERVLKYQIHTCGKHCKVRTSIPTLKKTLNRVKADFVSASRHLREDTFTDDSQRDDCAAYVDDLRRQYEKVSSQLNDIREKTDSADPSAAPERICKKRFPFSPCDGCSLDKETDRWSYFRTANQKTVITDGNIVEYNPQVLSMWDGQVNCQLIRVILLSLLSESVRKVVFPFRC